MPSNPEPNWKPFVAGSESIDDEGFAPVNEDPQPEQVDDNIAETPEEEILPGEAPDAALAGPETEVFYTFVWVGNRNRGGGNRRERDGQKGAPRGKGGKPQGKGAPRKAKGGKPQGGGKAKNYESRPRKEDKIDPDNPFAAALMGLKNKS